MHKRGFTLIELIVALLIIAAACYIISTSSIYSVKQRRKSKEIEHNLHLCSVILDCFKYKGSGGIKSIYDLSPRSPQEDASWYICFDTPEEIRTIIKNIDYFPEYQAFPNMPSEINGKRYIAFISISIRKGASNGFMEYPVMIQLLDSKQDISLPLRMDYEFICGL
jgi:prepilin-type N-terminal cleavage/methylation domain-containing protein